MQLMEPCKSGVSVHEGGITGWEIRLCAQIAALCGEIMLYMVTMSSLCYHHSYDVVVYAPYLPCP